MQTHIHYISSVARIAIAITAVWATASPTARADLTFFADRDAWKAEASKRGFLWGEEDFDDAPDGKFVPMVQVGDVQVWFGVLGFNGVASGRVVPSWDGASAVSLGSFGCCADGSGVWGPEFGIGFDVDLNTASDRFITVATRPEGVLFAAPNDYVSTSQQYAGDGFVGVLFDSPRKIRSFSFGGVNGSIEGVDNLVVAAAVVPEPSTFSLIVVAFLTLSLVRKRNL